VAEQVVEEVRLLDVVELVRAPDPPGHREAAVGEVREEVQLGQQALDADQLPAGGFAEHAVEVVEARDAVGREAHLRLRAQEGLAGAADQQLALAGVEALPDVVVGRGVAVPRLLDHAGRVDRDLAAVGLEVLEAARLVHPPTLAAGRRNGVAKLQAGGLYTQSCCATWRRGALK
jgi:hypothetical protein